MNQYMGPRNNMQRPPMGMPPGGPGMNYAGAVKNEKHQQNHHQNHQQNHQKNQQHNQHHNQQVKKEQQDLQPKPKKLRLEEMGFGNMGSGFGCSLFVPNQGEELPTMLQMGYAGEAPGTGFGDADEGTGFGNYADDVKSEPKLESKEDKPILGKMGPAGTLGLKDKGEKKTEWPPSLMDYISRAFSACRNDKEKDKTESYLKNLLNGRLKSGSAYEIDWESEPLPKDIFTDKNKDDKHRERNTARDCMFDPNRQDGRQRTPTPERGTQVRKMTKAEKKKKKRGDIQGLTNDQDTWEVEDPMEGVRKAARDIRFKTEEVERKKRIVPLSLQLGAMDKPRTFDPSKAKINGSSTAMFKPFLRLTTAPEPWEVRTRQQLPKSFQAVIAKWREEHNYKWTCEQLKSIRQDLTVQCIRDDFMVEVYETHARIAIEAADHSEFNQCQSQLAQLYKDGRKSRNRAEFAAYSIIYCLYTRNMTDMTKRLSQLTEEMAKDQIISDALKLRSHLSLGNYLGFFKIYKRSSQHVKLLVGKFIERERRKAIYTIVKAFRPTFPVTAVTNQLAFDTESEALQFLNENKLSIKDKAIDCKDSLDAISNMKIEHSL